MLNKNAQHMHFIIAYYMLFHVLQNLCSIQYAASEHKCLYLLYFNVSNECSLTDSLIHSLLFPWV